VKPAVSQTPCLLVVFLAACGGGSPPAPTTPSSSTAPAASASTASATASSSATPASADDEDDEVSSGGKAATAAAKASAPPRTGGTTPPTAVTLDTLFDKSAKKTDFPKKTADDAECVRKASLTGKNDKDYDSLLAACGAPTGMKEYTKKVTGKLDPKHTRDEYVVKMVGGYCYRFYAIGDDSVGNLDIRVQRRDGDLVSMDQSKQAVAILDPDQPWCKTHDREFHFVVETTSGTGAYTFGVWARPKK
jgi:hypothetical protein